MPTNRKTIQQLLEESESGSFVGREEEIKQFKGFISRAASLPKPILNIYGIGGVGKTYLLNQFRRICENSNVPIAIVDLRYDRGTVLEFIEQFRKLLGQRSVASEEAFAPYDASVSQLIKIQSKLQKRSSTDRHLATSATGDAVVALGSAGSGALLGTLLAPGVGTIVGAGFGAAGGRVAMDTLGGKIASSLVRQGLTEKEATLIVDADEKLTNAIADGINTLSLEAGRVVLAIDTYEEIAPAFDEWVREKLIPKLADDILIILSGRDIIHEQDPKWLRFSSLLQIQEINRFTEKEAKIFLSLKGVENPQIVDSIIQFTEQLPWALALLLDTFSEGLDVKTLVLGDSGHKHVVEHRVVERFLSQIKQSDLAGVIDICAAARRFDLDLLQSQLADTDIDRIRALYERLRRFSFVRTLPEGSLALHDVVRGFMINSLIANAPDTFKRINQNLFNYHKDKLHSSNIDGRRKRDAVESLYHALHYDENFGMEFFKNLLSQLDIYRYFDFRDSLLSEIIRFNFSEDNNKAWQNYCKAYQSIHKGNWKEALSILSNLNNSAKTLDPWLNCLILDALGEIHTGQGEYKLAAQLFRNSYEIRINKENENGFPGLPQTLSKLSESYAILSLFEQAEKYANENLELSQSKEDTVGAGWALKSLGDTYRLWGKAESAVSSLELAVKNFRGENDLFATSVALTQLGRVYTHVGKWKEAWDILSEAKVLYDNLWVEYGSANTILFQGNILRMKEQWSEAEEYYLNALEIHKGMDSLREIGPLLGSLGLVQFKQGRFSEGYSNLLESLKIKESQQYLRGTSVTQIYMGQYYTLQNEFNKALDWLNKSINNADHTHSNFLRADSRLEISKVYFLQHKYDLALKHLSKARKISAYYKYPHILSKTNFLQTLIHLAQQNYVKAENSLLRACSYAIKYNHYFLNLQLNDFIESIDDSIGKHEKNLLDNIFRSLISKWKSKDLDKIEAKSYYQQDAQFTGGLMKTCSNFLSRI